MPLFTITDYEEEEQWLRLRHNEGWRLVSFTVPCFYTFEQCEPEDVVYRLEFRQRRRGEGDGYIEMYRDYGWEYVGVCNSFHYFRKPASEGDLEIFSDDASRLGMVNDIFKKRMLPILCIFMCIIVPNALNAAERGYSIWINYFYYAAFLLYIYIFVRCGIGFYRLRKKYGDK